MCEELTKEEALDEELRNEHYEDCMRTHFGNPIEELDQATRIYF